MFLGTLLSCYSCCLSVWALLLMTSDLTSGCLQTRTTISELFYYWKKLVEKLLKKKHKDFILGQKVNAAVVTGDEIQESTVTFVKVYFKNESAWYLNCPRQLRKMRTSRDVFPPPHTFQRTPNHKRTSDELPFGVKFVVHTKLSLAFRFGKLLSSVILKQEEAI